MYLAIDGSSLVNHLNLVKSHQTSSLFLCSCALLPVNQVYSIEYTVYNYSAGLVCHVVGKLGRGLIENLHTVYCKILVE